MRRQYYTYITDKRCKRLGSQAWVFVCITLSELILNIKFGLDLFSHTQMSKMILWLTLTLFISSLGMFISMKIYKWRYSAKGDRNNEKFSNASEPDSPSRNTRSKGKGPFINYITHLGGGGEGVSNSVTICYGGGRGRGVGSFVLKR